VTDPTSAGAGPYDGVAVGFLTRHGKQEQIREPLERALGCRIVHTDAYDTDLLGSFTGEVARAGTALEAARRKAQLAMDLLGLDVGLGSEGMFGADPVGGLLPWNHEILVWVDRVRRVEVVGSVQGPAMHGRLEVRDAEALEPAAARLGFPVHALVLRAAGDVVGDDATAQVHKGVATTADLRRAFEVCRVASPSRLVRIETDLRAHLNPTRQRAIAAAAADLAQRLRCRCPACAAPGFGRERLEPGRICRGCGAPTRSPIAEILACVSCGHRARRSLDAEPGTSPTADPAVCDRCNP
jgi:hypothetical protein